MITEEQGTITNDWYVLQPETTNVKGSSLESLLGWIYSKTHVKEHQALTKTKTTKTSSKSPYSIFLGKSLGNM